MDRFARRHRIGTEKEFIFEAWEIEKVNASKYKYEGWLIKIDITGSCLILVGPGKHDSKLPKEGEKCTMSLYSIQKPRAPGSAPHKAHYAERETSLGVERVDNPCSAWGIKDEFWQKCMAFDLVIPPGHFKWLRPALSSKVVEKGFSEISRLDESKFGATFRIRVSTTTRDAEIGALDKLLSARKQSTQGMQRQVAAFSYLMNFQESFHVSLFTLFPQLPKDPHNPGESTLPPKLIERLRKLDSKQASAWTSSLGTCPNGICFVPGGPGAGKTFWNLTLAASTQTKVLYLLDINRPLTDVANKMLRLHRDMYGDSVKPWSVIRLFYWSYEQKSASLGKLGAMIKELHHRRKLKEEAGKLQDDTENGPLQPGPLMEYQESTEKDESKEINLQGFSGPFEGALRPPRLTNKKGGKTEECQASRLDEAAAAYYEAHKDTKYAQLTSLLSVGRYGLQDLMDHLAEEVYRDTLAEASFVATTPVTASKLTTHLYDSRLIIFDEAPHARELSIMISIAQFNPAAWILTGDHHQTKPYAGSLGNRPNINEFVEQLRVSTMERACRKDPSMPSLLVNHRAKAGLEKLASRLFYNSMMEPAVDPSHLGAIPATTAHLITNYIMPLKRGKGPEVPRLLVVLDTDERATRVQTSFYHPAHQRFAMRLIRRLVADKGFLQTNGRDRGTILVMSHYGRASIEYGKAIRDLARAEGAHRGCLVEARTIDVSQGHEADFVIQDFVNDRSTKHLEDPNRLCVGLTRARQAEILLMTEGMMTELESKAGLGKFPRQVSLIKMIRYCKEAGQYVKDPDMKLF